VNKGPFTITIWMARQQIIQGPPSYVGSFGPISQGANISVINFPTQYPAVLLVKPGHSTDECFTNPDAVVQVWGDMTAAQKQAIWGTANLAISGNQQLNFVGCTLAPYPQLPDLLPVNIPSPTHKSRGSEFNRSSGFFTFRPLRKWGPEFALAKRNSEWVAALCNRMFNGEVLGRWKGVDIPEYGFVTGAALLPSGVYVSAQYHTTPHTEVSHIFKLNKESATWNIIDHDPHTTRYSLGRTSRWAPTSIPNFFGRSKVRQKPSQSKRTTSFQRRSC